MMLNTAERLSKYCEVETEGKLEWAEKWMGLKGNEMRCQRSF